MYNKFKGPRKVRLSSPGPQLNLNKIIAHLIQKIKQNPDNTQVFALHERQFQSQNTYNPENP